MDSNVQYLFSMNIDVSSSSRSALIAAKSFVTEEMKANKKIVVYDRCNLIKLNQMRMSVDKKFMGTEKVGDHREVCIYV